MCFVCESGVNFKPGDFVIMNATGTSYNDNDEEIAVSQRIMREILEVHETAGTVKVRIGEPGMETFGYSTDYEWCWPSDFYARIRGNDFQTVEALMEKHTEKVDAEKAD